MPKTLIIGTDEFEFPQVGDNADWGQEVSDWAEAVSEALSSVQQPNDILRTSATINNNVTVPAVIPGFFFDTSEVRSINAEFIIKRTGTSPSTNLVDSGFITGSYDGTDWNISIRMTSNSTSGTGVSLDITSAGQVVYTSTFLNVTSHVGSIIFRAKVFNEDV